MDHDCHNDGRHFLQTADREYLYGQRNLTEKSASNTRTRIRERLRCALSDIDVLSRAPKRWNIGHMARGMDPEDNSEIYRGVVSSVSLAYSMADASDVDVEAVFAEGIRRSNPLANDVDVSINVEHQRPFDPEQVKEKIESGELPSPWEIGMLYWTDNEDILQKEATFGQETKSVETWIREFVRESEQNWDELDALWVDI